MALPSGCTSCGQTVTCTEATIPAGGSVAYDIPVKVSPSLSDGTNISLQGLVSSADAPSTNTQLMVPAFTQADVAIEKTGLAMVAPDGTITYTITVTNHGPSNAPSVTWHDPTDGNLTTITSYPCGNTSLTVTCDPGTLAAGVSRAFTITVQVNPGVPGPWSPTARKSEGEHSEPQLDQQRVVRQHGRRPTEPDTVHRDGQARHGPRPWCRPARPWNTRSTSPTTAQTTRRA